MNGANTEYANFSENLFVPLPPGIDPVEALCLVLNYVTADQMLHREARVQPGQRILVHGAAGGVGTAMLQLGKLDQLEMYGMPESINWPVCISPMACCIGPKTAPPPSLQLIIMLPDIIFMPSCISVITDVRSIRSFGSSALRSEIGATRSVRGSNLETF